ncbi:MAG TPA: hypothetical protein VGI10_14670 [Polyangiaceae bacterium]|jgi:hypothetical protein
MVTRARSFCLLAAGLLVACAKLWGFDDLKGSSGQAAAGSAGSPSTFCGNPPACAVGCTDCGECVDLSSDSNNCGACQTQCTSGRTCQASQCVCPADTTLCSGVCKNLNDDPDNCGTCALGCDGGVCGAGTCSAPTVIATDQELPSVIAVDESILYWSVTSGIVGMPVVGGAIAQIGVPGEATSLLVDASNLYWVSLGALYQMPKVGGAVLELVTSGVYSIALDSSNVYFTSSNGLNSVPIGGGSVTVLVASTQSGPVAIYAGTLYFGGYNQIYTAPLTGGSETPFLLTDAGPYGLLAQSPYLYFSTGAAIEELIDGHPQLAVTAQRAIGDFTTDNSALYFIDSRSSYDTTLGMAIYSSTLTHVVAAPTNVAPEASAVALAFDPSPQYLAVDATSVYYTSHGSNGIQGTVNRIAK